MSNPFKVVADFEAALCEYTGAPYAVAVSSCTDALLLCIDYHRITAGYAGPIEIPRHTYISVPMTILNLGLRIHFRKEEWQGLYRLEPLPIWDAARRFTAGMFGSNDPQRPATFICPSFHWSKILGIQQGGAILHNCGVADPILRRMRFDGRSEGVAPKDDTFPVRGWHRYMSPEVAAEGLVRLHFLPRHNPDLPWSDYPDLSKIPLFGGEGPLPQPHRSSA